MDLRHLTTARLRLDAVVPGDLDEHFALLSDPGSWAHYPSGRHTSREQTATGIEAAVGHWADSRLGYWTARLRDDLADDQVPPGLAPGAMVGLGGCATRSGTTWWNLYYRLARAAWGRGLASEIVGAALPAARQVDPARPVLAYLLEHNGQSRRLAERSGLTLVWRGPDTGNPDPDAVRLVYADRPVSPDVLEKATRLH